MAFDPETADATFGSHYVATIKVATSLVLNVVVIRQRVDGSQRELLRCVNTVLASCDSVLVQ